MLEQLISMLKFHFEGLIKTFVDSMCRVFESSFEPSSLKRVTEPHANLRAPARVYDVEGSAMFAKNSTFVFFDGFAWTSRLRSPSPIMAPGSNFTSVNSSSNNLPNSPFWLVI